ncbi:NAD(P)-binding protein [Pluteus cervinus]|uniref:NAD(P)-binding protein n=1 Tax=Pluteus cervinus TaxID=181527 RepID=A0ACD3A7J4_9AGAR|nr:NAD(P)-binding protein [Pluteus cervinus]
MSSLRPLLVVAGLGTGQGTGAATARLFAKSGYSVALIARGQDAVQGLAKKINDEGGNAAGFPIASYAPSDIQSAFSAIKTHFPAQTHTLKAAVWNAGAGVWKPFLEITEQDVQNSLDTNVVAAFAFARQVILGLKENELDNNGKKGTLIFTGATASVRGNVTTSAFSASKHALRALSQSLAKEFGKEKIHVSHVIIDGGIRTDRSIDRIQAGNGLEPDSIAQSYLYLANQDHSALTWELDLRPAVEKW